MVSSEDLNVGDVALEVPEALIINEDILRESDMCRILEKVDGITAETMMLLWSMKERNNPNSKFRKYFETLPLAFNTGLSFGIDALAELEGTLLFDEILQAREHLRKQYDELCPHLCNDYPEVFPPEMYTWNHFLWACELWYSNSMKVIFRDGKTKTCLIPIAGLLNHSIYPHILHYGRVDSASHTLKFRLSRPCKAGQQCYLNYGNHPTSHFVTFYGFIPKGSNPYDIIPLGAERLIRHLYANGIPTSIATGTHQRHFDLKTQKHRELFGSMHHVVKGDDPEVKNGKPSPDIYLVAAKRFEGCVDPSSILVFEDAPSGVAAGKNAGMWVVMVPDQRLDASYRKDADQVVDSLLDFQPGYWGLPPFPSDDQKSS